MTTRQEQKFVLRRVLGVLLALAVIGLASLVLS